MTLSRGLVLLVLALATGSAFAQPKPALVQDRDEPGRDPFQQISSTDDCIGESFCSVSFTPVPEGKRLVLTQMTIESSVANANVPIYVRVTNNLSARATFTITNTSTPRIATFPIMLFMSAGQTPTANGFTFDTEFQASFSITLVGYYITL